MNIEVLLNNLYKTNPVGFAILVLVFVICFLGQLRYYLTLQRTMNTVSPSLRPFPAQLIWLALIPVPYIGIVWYMVYVISLSLALRKELALRKLPGDGALGISLVTSGLLVMFLIPRFTMVVAIPTMVMLIMHWMRMSVFRKLLAEPVYMVVD